MSTPPETLAARPSLVLHDLTKRYGEGANVIDLLSHTFRPGTGTGLVGPNGSGKTTLLRLISCLAYPTAGRVTYGELDIHAHPHRYLRHVGLVQATEALPQYLSAVELIEYGLRARGAWSEAAMARAHGLLDRLGLDERRDALIGTYSSGMLKKTQVALALAPEPAVLLMDEPFRGLDTASTEAALDLVRSFKADGGLLILSSHLQPTLAAVCDEYLPFHPRRPSPHAAEA